MNKAITIELQFFMISILWGTILLFLYDGLRIFRRVIKHNSLFLAIEDLIYWVVASVFIFAMMYRENNGIIRGFSIMGMAIGMVLYHYIISEWFVTSVTKLIYTLIRPFALMFNWVKKFILFVLNKSKKLLQSFIGRLKKLHKSGRIALNKRKQKVLIKQTQKKEKKAAVKKQKTERKQAKRQAKKLTEKQAKKQAAKLEKKKVKREKIENKAKKNKPSGHEYEKKDDQEYKELKAIAGGKSKAQFEKVSKADIFVRKP